MSSQYKRFVESGFVQTSKVFSLTGEDPETIEFNGKVANVINGSLKSSMEMRNAGVDPNFDKQCALLSSDLTRLGISYEDEITVRGEVLRVVEIENSGVIATLMLKAS